MEILFQNTQDDAEAFYNYWCSETNDGQKHINQMYRRIQSQIILLSFLIFCVVVLQQVPILIALGISSLIFLITEAIVFFRANFKPKEYLAKQVSKSQAIPTSPRQLQFRLLPNNLFADDDWLEIHSSEQINKYRWNLIDYIWQTSGYIFVQTWPNKVIIVPQRCFSSEQSFIEFGNKLAELYKKNKNRAVGA